MPSRLDELLERIAALEREVEAELLATRDRWRYRIEAGRIRFERDAYLAQKRLKQRILVFLGESRPLVVLTVPLIYAMIVPIAFLDLSVSCYQAVCFRIYGIARVRRGGYIVIDRHLLAYLNAIEKVHCVYCGYAVGVIAYAREVAGRTEQYWCPIRHAKRVHAPHDRYKKFPAYGDAEGYQRQLPLLREELKKLPPDDES